jgi:hypothetical protein
MMKLPLFSTLLFSLAHLFMEFHGMTNITKSVICVIFNLPQIPIKDGVTNKGKRGSFKKCTKIELSIKRRNQSVTVSQGHFLSQRIA